MNKRIYELMAEAGFDPASIERMGVMPNAEKFAELIVQEAIKVAESQRDPSTLNYKPSQRFADELRYHFGVK